MSLIIEGFEVKMRHLLCLLRWVLVGLLHLLGGQSIARGSADLWFCSPTSHSVASEDSGAFASVCKPIGVDIKISGRGSGPPRGGAGRQQHKTEGVL